MNDARTSAPGLSFARWVAFVGLVVASAFLIGFERRAREIEEPGVGRLGLDPSDLGARIAWSRVRVTKAPDAADAALGDRLYAQWCVACHGEKGAGDGVLAKALDPPPRDFTKARFRLRTTPEGSLPSDGDLFRTVTAGILPARMPSFAALADAERWALVSKVKRLAVFFDEDEKKEQNHFELLPPEPAATFPPFEHASDPDVLARGKKLFETKAECWKCHGVSGRADGPSADTLKSEEGFSIRAANLRRGPVFLKAVVDAGDVFRVMKLGISGTPMPSYSSALSDPEMHDVAAFTASLWTIARREPVPAIPLGSTAMTDEASALALGERTFLESCAGCHGKAARGDGAATTLLDTKPASFVAGAFKLKSVGDGYLATLDDLRRTIRRGVPGTSMPAWPFHSEAEVDALARYVREIAGPRTRPDGAAVSVPSPPAGRMRATAALDHGAELFKAQCVACHGEGGRGDGALAAMLQDFRGERLRPRNFVDEPLKSGRDPSAVFRTISHGFEGTPMPGFAAAISEADRWDLVAYVLSLAAPPSAMATGVLR